MLSFIAFLAALLLPPAASELPAVRGLGVVPGEGRTEVVIAVDGAITATDFQLGNPARIVIDLDGTAERREYPGIQRGGVRAMRVAQNAPGVVRVVIDLDGPVSYRVDRLPGQVRVSFPNAAGAFEPWTTGDVEGLLDAAVAAAANALAATAPPPAGDTAPTRDLVLAAAPPVRPAPAPRRQDPQELRIEMVFENMTVGQIASQLMAVVNRTIVVESTIRENTITAEIRDDLPWRQAFESILRANAMALVEDTNGILQIVSAAAAAERLAISEPLETRTFELSYVSADSLAPQIQGMVSPDSGSVAVVTASNALVVSDFPSRLARIEDVLSRLDVPAIQVAIKANITFVDRTALESLGVVYDLKDSQGNQLNTLVAGYQDTNGNGILEPEEATTESVILLGGNSIAALGNAGARVAGSPLELVTSLVLGRHTLITFLQALQEVNLSDIQAQPMVQTMNHRQANIQVGERTPVRVIDAGGGGAAGGQAPTATVDYQDTGVILRVTPHVTGESIRMVIHAERSNIAVGPADLGAIFATQMAETEVTVQDGETVVIGGLTIEEKSVARQGIPILMDLPVIGALFRNTTDRLNKRDLIITVTPYIIRNN